MRTRILSAIVALAILIPIFYIGGITFDVAVYLVTILSFREFIKARDKEIPDFIRFISYFFITLLYFKLIFTDEFSFIIDYRLLSGVFLLVLLPVVLYHNEKAYNINDAFYVLCGLLFLGFSIPLFCVYRSIGLRVIVYLLSITITNDTYAYIIGTLIGRHKLLEDVSPNKTIEGLVGGAVVSTFVGTMFFITVIGANISVYQVILITLFLSIVANIGDLFFSAIKRAYKLKDFSNIMPGHGGVLDRMDSIIFVMLAFTFFISILG